jgi:hypothetical protein
MIRHCTRFLAICIIVMHAAWLRAEEERPDNTNVDTRHVVGTTPIVISYSSPRVKGRTIWGELLPFGENWFAGADRKTTIRFEEDVRINGNILPAGLYGFYVFLNAADDWQLVFSRDSTGSATPLNKSDDVLRVAVRPEAAPHRERLRFGIENVTKKEPYRASLFLHWETKKVAIKVQMTGRRKRDGGAPEIPEHAEAAWAVVQRSLNAQVAEDVEQTIREFADDFETDFGDGGGKAAYAQLLNNLKRGGLLEEMDVDLSGLTFEVEADKAVFENIEVRAPFDTFSLSYELQNRSGNWVVISLSGS